MACSLASTYCDKTSSFAAQSFYYLSHLFRGFTAKKKNKLQLHSFNFGMLMWASEGNFRETLLKTHGS